MSFSLLESSIFILRISESIITKGWDARRRRQCFFNMLAAFDAMHSGMSSFLSPITKFLVYCIVGILFLGGVALLYPISPSDLNSFRFVVFAISFCLVAFSLPSSYVSDKIGDAHVQEVIAQIRAYGPMNTKEIKALESTIGEFHARALARVGAFQWVMAASWALATYVFSQLTGVALKISPVSNGLQVIADGGMHLAIFAFLSLIMLWAVFGYKRSVDRIFKLSLLSLRQFELELATDEKNKSYHKEVLVDAIHS